MLTAEEKKEHVTALISLPLETMDQVTAQKQLHELLLHDTIGGKLYKYRAFDEKGYSLKNLEDGTLHCSSSAAFNDPFDCKIGITFQSLYAAKCGIEFDLICKVLEKFILVIHKEIDVEDCDEDERCVILRLMGSERLMRFVREDYSWISTEDEMAALLKANAVIILELMRIVLEDQSIAPSLGTCASMLPKLLASISEDGMLQLAKDNSTIQDFAKANGIDEDADEIELTMLLSKKINPELAGTMADVQKLLDDWEQKVSVRMAELFLVGCLCTSYKNRLMWSHYADSHKGFCVEYDFSEPNAETLNMLPLPVMYSEKRPLIPWEAAFEKTPENMEETWRQLAIGLLTKDSEWSYENEWRILINSTETSEVKMPRISCVYLGASITEENRNKILDIARRKHIPVKQMKVDRGEYDLHAVPLEIL